MQTLYIFRALPGSGKSTLAKALALGHDAAILCLDDKRYDQNGNYVYAPEKEVELESQRYEECTSLMEKGKPMIIIDGVNYRREHVEKYESLGKDFGYVVTIIEIPHQDPKLLVDRNIHSVPITAIQKMIIKWDYLGFTMPWHRLWRKAKKKLKFWK